MTSRLKPFQVVLFALLLSTGVVAQARSGSPQTHRCFLDVPSYRSQFGIFKAFGATKAEATGKVVSLCEASVKPEDRDLCIAHAFQDDSEHLNCDRSAAIEF